MSAKTQRAVLAGGCFWGMQELIRKLPGVVSTRVGYTGGDVPHATYRNHGTHAEGIEILFDPSMLSWDGWRCRAETAAIQLGKGEDLDAIGKTADRVITAFRTSEFARPQGRIIGVEEELRSPLIPGLPDILGRIDLIVETDEALKIIDLKTARTRWSTEQAERSGEQLLLYAALAKDLVPGKPIQLEFAVVTKTANPVVETLPVAWDPTRIDRTQRVMAKVWSAIEAGNFYPAPSPTACPTCPFRTECEAWRG